MTKNKTLTLDEIFEAAGITDRPILKKQLKRLMVAERLDELEHIGLTPVEDGDDEIIVCYFHEDGDCHRDLSIGDRIAQLNKEDK